jgi:hypothetical protein
MDRLVKLTESTSDPDVEHRALILAALHFAYWLLYRFFGFRYHGACQGRGYGTLALTGWEALVDDHGPDTPNTVQGLSS